MNKSIVIFCVGMAMISGMLDATFAPGGPAPGKWGQLGKQKGKHLKDQDGMPSRSQPAPQEKKLEKIYQASNPSEFDRLVKQSHTPVVVKFYDNNKPSFEMNLLDEEVASMFGQEETLSSVGGWGSEVKIWKPNVMIVNVNKVTNSKIAQRYKVRIIPAYLFFKNGKEVERHIGKMDKAMYLQKVRSLKTR